MRREDYFAKHDKRCWESKLLLILYCRVIKINVLIKCAFKISENIDIPIGRLNIEVEYIVKV